MIRNSGCRQSPRPPARRRALGHNHWWSFSKWTDPRTLLLRLLPERWSATSGARSRTPATRSASRNRGCPRRATSKRIIDAAFWASLRREEGYDPEDLARLPAPRTHRRTADVRAAHLRSGRPRSPSSRRRSSVPASISACGAKDGALASGARRATSRTYCFVVEVVEPGLLVVKHRRSDAGKFVNVLVLEGDQIKIVDERASTLARLPAAADVAPRIPGRRARTTDDVNVLVQLAVSMRAHGRGGSLLVVPTGQRRWRESIVEPAGYAISPPFPELALLMREPAAVRHERQWHGQRCTARSKRSPG